MTLVRQHTGELVIKRKVQRSSCWTNQLQASCLASSWYQGRTNNTVAPWWNIHKSLEVSKRNDMVNELAGSWSEKLHATLVTQLVLATVMCQRGSCCETSSPSDISCVGLLLHITPTLFFLKGQFDIWFVRQKWMLVMPLWSCPLCADGRGGQRCRQ